MDITIERLIASVECPGCIIAEALRSRMHELYWVSNPWKKELGQCLGVVREVWTYECIEIVMSSVCHIK